MIGTVVGLTGKAWVREADGSLRELTVGAAVTDTQTLILAPGAAVSVNYGVGAEAQLVQYTGTENSFTIVPAGEQEAIPALPEIESMIQRELAGEAPRSGDPSQAEDGPQDSAGTVYGHNFVELVRIEEDLEANGITPLSLARVREAIRPMDVAWTDPEEEEVTWLRGGAQANEEEAINRGPEARPETQVIAEDEIAAGSVLANDSDPENDALSVTQYLVAGEVHPAGETASIAGVGTLVINTDGSYVFTPAGDWHGAVPTVTYTMSDGRGGLATSTLDITVTPVTDIAPDATTTHAGDPVTTVVLATDSFENANAEVTAVTQGAHGAVVINPDGTITYTPQDGYVGPDSYTYTVTSGGVTETTTVTIDVTNTPPVPAPEIEATPEDTPLAGNVLANETDADGDPLTVTQFVVGGQTYAAGQTATIAGVGTLVLNSDGGYLFTPVADWNGTVPTVTYTVIDGAQGGLATSTLEITVTPVPDIAPDTVTTHAGDPVTTTVLGNDSFENSEAEVTAVTQGAHGAVVINPDGTITYTPQDGYVGPDSYTYTVTSGGVTETTTVTIDVTNTPPVRAPEIEATPEDTPLAGNVLANETDADGDPLTVTQFVVGGQTYAAGQTATIAGVGTLVVNSDGGYVFTPVADWNGTVPTVTYAVIDGNQGGLAISTLDITVTPVTDVAPDAITTRAGDPVTTAVLGNDSFENADAEITAVTQGAHGAVVINPDGTITYTPQDGYVGPDSYTYTVTSGGVTETTTVTIEVINTPPVAAPEAETTPEDTPLAGNVLANDADPEGHPLTVVEFLLGGQVYAAGQTATIPGAGTLVLNTDGSYVFTPVADWNGTVPTATYTVSDGLGGFATSTLDITVTPVTDIAPDAVTTHAGDPVTTTVLGNDSFENGDAAVTSVTQGAHATVVINPNGTITYTPQDGYVGPDSYTYTVTSGGVTETITVTVDVTNAPPVATPETETTPEDTPLAGNVLANETDADGDPLTVTRFVVGGQTYAAGHTATIAGVGTLVLNSDGGYVFTPVADWNGTVPTVTYTVIDGNQGGLATSTLDITVTPVNDAPEAVQLPGRADEDADVIAGVDITGGFTDVEGDTLTYSATGLPPGLSIDAVTGIISGTIDNSASQGGTGGVYSVVVTATDGSGATATQSFDWTVTNPAPTAADDAGSTDEATVLTVTAANGVLGNDGDPDGDALTVSEVNGDAANVGVAVAGDLGGTFTLNADGGYDFDPAGDFEDLAVGESRTTSITYTVSDGEGGTRQATLTVTVNGVNDAPQTAATLPAQVNEDADAIVSVDVTGAFSDADTTDALTYSATGLPPGLSIDAVTGIISGTIDNSASQGGTGGVYSVVVTATDGSLTVNRDGSWSYTSDAEATSGASVDHPKPANDASIDDVFNYNVIDGDGDISGWVSQTVAVTDTAPSIGTPEGDSVSEAHLTGGTDPDPAALTQTGTLAVTKAADGIDVTFAGTQTALQGLGLTSKGVALVYTVSNDGHTLTATAGVAGAVVFIATITDPTTADAGYSFVLSQPLDHVGASIALPIAYGVADADGDTDSDSFTITIVDDQPENLAFELNEDSSAGVTFNTSADGTGSNVSITDAPPRGEATVNPDGTITYIPDPNFSGVDVFTYTTTADNGSAVETTVTVTVNPVSDAPTVTRDAASVVTNEDTAVALGLNAPLRTDTTDQNGGGAGDNPERLGEITLTGIPSGAQILDGSGNLLFTSTGGAITIQLSDGLHIPGLTTTLTMDSTTYEALRVLPPPEAHANFTVNVSVTSYEVEDDGAPISDVPGAASSTSVAVRVQAVTDGVELSLVDGADADSGAGSEMDHTIAEGSNFNLASLLSASFLDGDGNGSTDVDGSELRWFEITGLPVGTVVNGVTVATADQVVTVAAPAMSTSASGLPTMTITPPVNFSGDVSVTVTLKAQDRDSDGVGSGSTTGGIVQDAVTLDLHVTPLGGDVAGSNVSVPEDTLAAFLSGVRVTDTDGNGSEVITEVEFEVPAGWTVSDTDGRAGYTAGLSGSTYTITFDTSLTQADREAVLDGFRIEPPAHSSADVTISVNVTTADTVTVDGGSVTSTVTQAVPITVALTPVAEKVDEDIDGDGVDDLVMTPSHAYATAGTEDAWFTLGTDGGFNLEAGWANQDGNEQAYARLTPEVVAGDGGGNSAVGSQFRYMDDEGAWVTLTYTGAPVDIPVEYLDTLQFKAPENLSGSFKINVQAYTVDNDTDSGAQNTAVSGLAELTNVIVNPVADEVTLALNARVTGLEDERVALNIRPTSSDPSETFTVTISGIPAGADLYYDGVLQTQTGGSVTIANFDSAKPLGLQPPPNSNADFTLDVSAVSVDGAAVSTAEQLTIDVSLRGVADVATVTPLDATYIESALDNGSDQVFLHELASASLFDNDGSETLTFRVTGLPEGFSLTGGTMLVGGVGTERVWVITQSQFGTVTVKTPANFSGTQAFSITPVTTENDGDSRTGDVETIEITVTPSPEAGVTTSATLTEDALTPLNLSIVHQNGDADETLTTVWISVDDLASADFALYVGATPIAAAGLDTDVIDGETYYVLTGAQIGQLAAQGASNLDGALGAFGFKYEITDNSYGSTPAGTSAVSVQDATFTLTAEPATDPISVSITSISGAAGTTVVSNEHANDDANPDTAVLQSGDQVTVTLNVAVQPDLGSLDDTADTDGSESVIRIVIQGVPDGVSVDGAQYSGGGTWLLIYEGVDALPISGGAISVPLVFDVSGYAGGIENAPITIQVQTQDRGGQNPAAAIQADTVTWHLTTDFTGGGGEEPATIVEWEYNGGQATEDAAFSLSDVVTAQVAIVNPAIPNTFTVTITDFPSGTTFDGMVRTTVGGQEVWTASVTVAPGDDAALALQGLLDSIEITPPEDSNENNNAGGFSFDATLTASVPNGPSASDVIDNMVVPVQPVTDAAVISISAEAIDEGVASMPVTITVSNDADGPHGAIVEGKLYVKVEATGSTNGLENGVLTYNGVALETETVDGVEYYVVEGVTAGAAVELMYTPNTSTAGVVAFSAMLKTQEANSAAVATGTTSGSGEVIIINNGVTVSSGVSTGAESGQVQITDLVVALVDNDGSEAITTVLLSNVPNGFLVYVGDSAGVATLADNAGNGNTWVISKPDGSIPAYVAIVPPDYWSGTLSDLTVAVESRESVFSDGIIQTFELGDVVVTPVADGIDLTTTNTFGPENGIIALNLNASMVDPADASAGGAVDANQETTTLTLTGLGAFASFYVGSDPLLTGVSYDEGADTYTLTGLSQADLDQLGFLQARNALTDQNGSAAGVQIAVQAFTTDGSSTSAVETAEITVNAYAQLATVNDDSLLWTGAAIDAGAGTDTVQLRLGEDLSGAQLDAQLSNVEVLALNGNAISSLTAADVLGITGSGAILTLLGDDDDSVTFDAGWASGGTEVIGGIEYAIYTATAGATDVEVRVQSGIQD